MDFTQKNKEPIKGIAVIIDGEVVSWFKEFREKEREYCTKNYYEKWLLAIIEPHIEFFQQCADFTKALEEQEL